MKAASILLAAALFFSFSSISSAQEALKKGVYNLSGTVSFSSSENDDPNGTTKQESFTLSPSGNYFVIDNLLVGAGISYNYAEFKFDPKNYPSQKFIDRQVGISANVKYYFGGITVFPFVGVRGSYFKYIGGGTNEGRSFTGSIGIDYFFSRSVALEPSISYTISKYTNPDQNVKNFVIGIGVAYFIIP